MSALRTRRAAPAARTSAPANEQRTSIAKTPPSALEQRVTARKRELIVEVLEHKKSLRLGAPDALRHLEGRLSHLRILLADVVVHGWAGLGDERRAELDLWVAQ